MPSGTCSEEVIVRENVNRKYGETTPKNRNMFSEELKTQEVKV